jgi:hypothetical protein
MWSLVGLGLAAAIAYAVRARERHLAGPNDLGSVSNQWIAEYRAHQAADRSG